MGNNPKIPFKKHGHFSFNASIGTYRRDKAEKLSPIYGSPKRLAIDVQCELHCRAVVLPDAASKEKNDLGPE
jgi:hypothetical protein